MTNVEALKALYAALGGEPADVVNASTIVEVLNAIAAKFDGEDTATINSDAIANIAAVAGDIGGGGTQYNSFVFDDATGPAVGTYEPFNNTDDSMASHVIEMSMSERTRVSVLYSSYIKKFTNLKTLYVPSNVMTFQVNSGDVSMFRNNTSLEKIIINKPENSISGAPWGAPDTTQVVWTG